MEGNADANTAEGGIGGAEEERDDIFGALVVATPALSKGVPTMDRGATTRPVKVVCALTSTAGATS